MRNSISATLTLARTLVKNEFYNTKESWVLSALVTIDRPVGGQYCKT
jgi:hypothetical protein